MLKYGTALPLIIQKLYHIYNIFSINIIQQSAADILFMLHSYLIDLVDFL